MIWVWVGVFFLALFLELVTEELVSVWFCAGSFVSFILALCHVDNITIQIVVFVVVSLVLLLCTRKFLKKLLDNAKEKTNTDLIIGTTHTLIKDIEEEKAGEVKINDIVWSAVSSNGEGIKAKTKVKIVKVKGNKLVVEKEKK